MKSKLVKIKFKAFEEKCSLANYFKLNEEYYALAEDHDDSTNNMFHILHENTGVWSCYDPHGHQVEILEVGNIEDAFQK